MAKWTKFAGEGNSYAADALKRNWAALHRGDCEALPKDAGLANGWRSFHAGDFQAAHEAGLAAGVAGHSLANLAANIYANYVEKKDAAKVALYKDVMNRAEAHQKADPKHPNAFYLYAYAAGRYSQSISIVKALAEGYGGKIKSALETCLKLEPKHAHAHIAMGAYHAEIIDKVGAMVGGLTYGAKKDLGEKHFKEAIKLAPESPIAHMEYANGLLMLFGDKKMDEATGLYVKASEMQPVDAMTWLDIEAAKAELEDE
jgi:tetratricopeptide (TPR) repeat protein